MVALLMESKPDSDMLRAGPTLVWFVSVFGSRLLEVLAPERLVTSEAGVALRMLLCASASAPDMILARAILAAPVTEQTVFTATEKTRKHCSFLHLPMLVQFLSNEVYFLPLTCIGRAFVHHPF
jgi:hypothetical protein